MRRWDSLYWTDFTVRARRGRLTQRAASCRNSVSDFRWWRWGELWLEHCNSQSIVRPAHPCRAWWAVWASSALQYTAPMCSTHLCVGKIWLKSGPRSPAVHWFTNRLTVLTAAPHFPGGHSHTPNRAPKQTGVQTLTHTLAHNIQCALSVADANTHKSAQQKRNTQMHTRASARANTHTHSGATQELHISIY